MSETGGGGDGRQGPGEEEDNEEEDEEEENEEEKENEEKEQGEEERGSLSFSAGPWETTMGSFSIILITRIIVFDTQSICGDQKHLRLG